MVQGHELHRYFVEKHRIVSVLSITKSLQVSINKLFYYTQHYLILKIAKYIDYIMNYYYIRHRQYQKYFVTLISSNASSV